MSGERANRQALLIDLDGVIYQGEQPIVGAIDTINWLRQQQIPYLFVTNTTSCSRRALLKKFNGLGFNAQLEEILTPIVAASQWLLGQQLNRAAIFVNQQAIEDFANIESIPVTDESAVDAVVIGDLGDGWDYATLNAAFRFLMQQPAPELIALGMTRYWRARDGLRLDVAPFVTALECATDRRARVFGKPAPAFFSAALDGLNCDATQALIIGDDIVGDIDAAQCCGIRGIQVKTGKFREPDLEGVIKPYAVLESIADLPAWWHSR